MRKQELLARYLGGPVEFSGSDQALYERHLIFDRAIPPAAATPRDKFEAIARSVRDLLSQRWMKTEALYQERNVKRVYYLSLEFLIGRALANNITNLRVEPIWQQLCKTYGLHPFDILDQEPDAGLGNGGLGRLAACFLDSMATLGIPGMGCGLRYEYGIFKQQIKDGSQIERPDHWLARPDPWEIARPNESVEVQLGCSFDVRGGELRVIQGRPSTLIGCPDLPGRDARSAARTAARAGAAVSPWLLLEQSAWAGVAALGFAILFNVSPRTLWACTLSGSLAYAARGGLVGTQLGSLELASLYAATLASMLCVAVVVP
jgi:starch phosphorylase